MSSNPIIQIQNLGKKYLLKGSQVSHDRNLMEQLSFWFKNPDKFKKNEREFWALQNLNLSIYAGQTIGIIGANGSGKSTILKILSRVTRPTTGRVEIFGRVSALLEVGTGFHLELSGRENIFLSGAMLGMKRSEIIKYFDEIVTFSGIENFLEIPVKRYSSGMFLRLAFSVMSHLKSDILIIDEILAVGDAQFQAKCLEKMKVIMNEGRTIILVSHQFDKIRTICQQTLWIKEGCLFDIGATATVLKQYETLTKVQTENLLNDSSAIPHELLL